MVDWLACGAGMENSLQVMEGQLTLYRINYIERSVCYVGCLCAVCDTVCVNKADRQTKKVKFCQQNANRVQTHTSFYTFSPDLLQQH